MATVALIQDLFPVLLHPSGEKLSGLERQIYDNFFEALEEEYNHDLQIAETLDAYQEGGHAPPDVIIYAPFEEGVNPAAGLAQLSLFQEVFPGLPIIVWSARSEESLRATCLDDLGCAAYYTGTLLGAPEDLPSLIAEALA